MRQDLKELVAAASDPGRGARQTRAAARLMSILEAEPHRLPDVFRHLPSGDWPRPRLVLGITGAPGSGKSTLTDVLVAEYRHRHPDRKVGAIAVDPSSPFTGGAVLGDRVRMMRHALDPNVFIRSLASRGHLGGLSLGVRGALRIMGLIGCDLVIIETVGVGQSEVEVAGVADQVLVVLAPGQGDAVQMLKAGLMEIADLFVINKADMPGADRLKGSLQSTISLGFGEVAAGSTKAPPEIFLVSATEQTGITELLDMLENRIGDQSEKWQAERDARVLDEVRDAVIEDVRVRLSELLDGNGSRADLQRVIDGELSVADVAVRLLAETQQKLTTT